MSAFDSTLFQGDLQDQKHSGHQSPLGVTRTETVTLSGIRTQSGFTFEQVDVSYQTLGVLSPARDNAILVCHALSGDAHVAGVHPETGRPGWWDFHVGPGKAIDTDKFLLFPPTSWAVAVAQPVRCHIIQKQGGAMAWTFRR